MSSSHYKHLITNPHRAPLEIYFSHPLLISFDTPSVDFAFRVSQIHVAQHSCKSQLQRMELQRPLSRPKGALFLLLTHCQAILLLVTYSACKTLCHISKTGDRHPEGPEQISCCPENLAKLFSRLVVP